ncbi:MAG: hydrogenase maturation protease, partial [Desulfuromonadales bacterium]|nr:hydrogenase maturation protease [Desulfuromonadales bacterium]
MSILVLGLGNTIMTDDGFGVEVVTTLSSRYHFQGPVKILDGGTLGLDLLPHLEEIESLLIIDALDMRDEPGKIFRLQGDEVPRAFASKLSVHQMGLQDLLAVAELQGHVQRNLVVWGVQAECIEMGTDM